tara:strand:- start:137 stop:349 length:213 start_codon:yes stop_codon:yes gene_type:complete
VYYTGGRPGKDYIQDSKKTKDQLIEELAELRTRLDVVIGTAPDEQADSQHRSDRKEIKTSIQFFGQRHRL